MFQNSGMTSVWIKTTSFLWKCQTQHAWGSQSRIRHLHLVEQVLNHTDQQRRQLIQAGHIQIQKRWENQSKDQTPSFGKAGAESHRTTTTTTTTCSGKPQTDSEKMRKPNKNQTPLFGRAGAESHRVETSSGTSVRKSRTDSEKMRKPIRSNAPSFAQDNVR